MAVLPLNGKENSLINKGVIQGGTISPLLFTIFVNDLITTLDKKGYQTSLMLTILLYWVLGKKTTQSMVDYLELAAGQQHGSQ